MRGRRATAPVLCGLLAAAGVLAVRSHEPRLAPGRPGWTRMARGAGPAGALGRGATFLLPGLPRRTPSRVLVAAETAGGPATLEVSVDGAPPLLVRAGPQAPALVALPVARAPGARLDLRAADGPVRLLAIDVQRSAGLAWLPALVAALVAFGITRGASFAVDGRAAVALGLFTAGVLGIAATPLLLLWSLPGGAALVRLALPAATAAAGIWVGAAAQRAARATFLRGAVLTLALVGGGIVRAHLLPSAGSWDTEYWKAWMGRAVSHGITRVYGDPGETDPGRFLSQLTGDEELWKLRVGGRAFVVDYPPLAMALWRWSWWAVERAAPGLPPEEKRNVAVKLPPLLGDIGGVALLLWAFRHEPRRALGLAALYWVFPVSWLSGPVLGFLDGAYAPLMAAALVAAGRGRAVSAGVFLALACLVKPLAAVVVPAVLVALLAARASWRRAAAAALGVGIAALVPFFVAGTGALAVAQMWRIFFQKILSGGFPNLWWIVGHAVSASDAGGWTAPVRFTPIAAVPFPVRTVGVVLFAAAAGYMCWRQRKAAGPLAACLAGAALVYAYALLAVGVHENHPQSLFLLFLGTGLPSARLRLVALGSGAALTLNMLALSGLGRFYGPRHAALEPLLRRASEIRMLAGFDLTLLLAAANLALLAMLLAGLAAEMRRLAGERGRGAL